VEASGGQSTANTKVCTKLAETSATIDQLFAVAAEKPTKRSPVRSWKETSDNRASALDLTANCGYFNRAKQTDDKVPNKSDAVSLFADSPVTSSSSSKDTVRAASTLAATVETLSVGLSACHVSNPKTIKTEAEDMKAPASKIICIPDSPEICTIPLSERLKMRRNGISTENLRGVSSSSRIGCIDDSTAVPLSEREVAGQQSAKVATTKAPMQRAHSATVVNNSGTTGPIDNHEVPDWSKDYVGFTHTYDISSPATYFTGAFGSTAAADYSVRKDSTCPYGHATQGTHTSSTVRANINRNNNTHPSNEAADRMRVANDVPLQPMKSQQSKAPVKSAYSGGSATLSSMEAHRRRAVAVNDDIESDADTPCRNKTCSQASLSQPKASQQSLAAPKAKPTAVCGNFTSANGTAVVRSGSGCNQDDEPGDQDEEEREGEKVEDLEKITLKGGIHAWEPVLLVDTREKDHNLIQTRMIECGIPCEVCTLALGDFMWAARLKKSSAFDEDSGDDDENVNPQRQKNISAYFSVQSSCSGSGGHVGSAMTQEGHVSSGEGQRGKKGTAGSKKGKKKAKEQVVTLVVLDTIAERKTTADLASSIVDGRYAEQKRRLKECGLTSRMYIVEGLSLAMPRQSTVTTAGLKTAMVSTQV
jgi:hypothetical protein